MNLIINKFKKRITIYTKIIFSIIIIIEITIAIVSCILYSNFKNNTIELLNLSIKDNLSQLDYTSSLMNNLARSMALQLYTNNSTSSLYTNSNIDTTSIDFIKTISNLSTIALTNPFVQSIYIYIIGALILFILVMGEVVSKPGINLQITILRIFLIITMKNIFCTQFLVP